jgi:microcompartment protein CcmL/EutN
VNLTEIQQALARGYCHAMNEKKVVNHRLIAAMAGEILAALQEENKTTVVLLKELKQYIGCELSTSKRRELKEAVNAVIAQSLPQALTAGSTSTVHSCDHAGVHWLNDRNEIICGKCNGIMNSRTKATRFYWNK